MGAKILVNGVAGSGKTNLIKTLTDAFVISRDGKAFPFNIPHMVVPEFYSMDIMINGGEVEVDGEGVVIEGFYDKMEKYNEKIGSYPKTIVLDSASKLMQDIIDFANLNFTNFDIHSHINREIAVLTKFVQEGLVANDMNVIIINHVMDNDKLGLIPIGQGKFKDKGSWYSEVDHAILVENMKVTHRGVKSQARTTIATLPDKQYVENDVNPSKSKKLQEGEVYYDLQKHIDMILETQNSNAEWKF